MQDIKNDGARYAFITRWHDPMTDIVWRYQFMYHTSDRSIEMVSHIQSQFTLVNQGITFFTFLEAMQDVRMGDR